MTASSIRVPPSILGVPTTAAPARFSPGAASVTALSYEQVIADLYAKRVLNKQQVATAVVKLKLKLPALATALGLSSVNQLMEEFINDPGDMPSYEVEKRQNFTLAEAIEVLYSGKSNKQLAEEMPHRTQKAIQNFRWRTLKQGLRVNQAVYELVAEGQKPEDINVLGFPLWMIEFTDMVHKLQVYARMHHKQEPKVFWGD